ncbi:MULTISPECIES: diguanylate cyclase [unclassified Stenotrophomonas]|uniref:GGDEF domain-containing protein n=1 Tax=unclassified Stenotrophomonas TaxID=196198 RepID=UPI002117BBF6|nr:MULTISPECIES: diguanylate cyclase [unclassified Stenotrophomonas]
MNCLSLVRRSLPALLCVAVALSTPPAQAQRAGAGMPLVAQVEQCNALLASTPETSLQIAKALLARPTLPTSVEIGAIACLGMGLRSQGRLEETAGLPERLLAAVKHSDATAEDTLRARSMAAHLLLWRGDQAQALELTRTFLDESVRTRDVHGQISALMQIAMIRGDAMGDAQGALTYLQKAAALSEHLRRPPNPGDMLIHYNVGYALLSMQRYEEAQTAFDRAAAIGARLSGQDLLMHRITSHRAEIRRVRGELDQAQKGLDQALAWQTTQDAQGRIITLQRLARLALDRDQAAKGLALAEQAQTLADSGNFTDEIRHGLDVLGDAHTLLGQRQQALQVARQARELDQARSKGDTLNRLAKLQASAERRIAPAEVNAEQDLGRVRVVRNSAVAALLAVLAIAAFLILRLRRQRRELAALSRTDAVTDLPNRHEAERLLGDARASGQRRSALLLLEIDDFKALNDRHGQAGGDALLRAVARCLHSAVDRGDLVARWGGARFLVARHDTSDAAAQALANHLRTRIERLLVEIRPGQPITLSASLGVAPLPLFADQSGQLDDSLRAADRALQTAHRSGHNAWASLWGAAIGMEVDLHNLLHDPTEAQVLGWVTLAGSRPMPWMPPRPEPVRPSAAATEATTGQRG